MPVKIRMGERILYKYLDVNGGLAMLQNHNLQFTNATRLNDPFDCHPSLFDYSKAPKNEYNWPPSDFLRQKGENDLENRRNDTWICSLSKIHDSLLMWSYYGNHHGVCVGLDIEKSQEYLSKIICSILIGVLKMEVQYKDIIEKPDYFNNKVDILRYQLSTKAKAWEHEQEVRLLLINPTPSGLIDHPCFAPMLLPYKPKDKNEMIDWKEVRAYPRIGGECFCSIYLGVNIGEEEKAKIIKVARSCNPEIKIYQMTIDPDAFRLKEEMI
jgi:hypothetical protein